MLGRYLVDIQNWLPDKNLIDITQILPLAAFSAFLVGLSKGGLSAAAGLAVPIMALRVDPLSAAALLLPIYLISDVFGVWIYRKNFSARNLSLLIPAGLAGVLIGYLLAPVLSAAMINVVLALIGLSYCLRAWFGGAYLNRQRPADAPRGIFWGTIAGLTSFVSHSGAVPFQMYTLPQKMPRLVFAGTATITFAVINLAKLPPYLALGQFPDFQLMPTVVLITTALIGVVAGRNLTQFLPERVFYKIIEIALFLVSVRLLANALPHLT